MTRNAELAPLLKRLQARAPWPPPCPSAWPWPAGSSWTTLHSWKSSSADEVNRRADRRIELRLQGAGFEETCRLEDFDWSAALDRRLLDAVFSLEFLAKHEHVLLVGPAGVGKSFMAQALGFTAIRAGYTVRFVHSDDFFRAMAQARVDNSVDRTFRSFLAPDLLILDDLGLHRLTAQQSGRPLPVNYQQAPGLQLRHHQQPRRGRMAQSFRRPHPGEQRPGPVGQRQLPDCNGGLQLPGKAVAAPGPAGVKGGD